jgi:hypothetical protein
MKVCHVGSAVIRPMAGYVDRALGDRLFRWNAEMNAFKYAQEVGWMRIADQYGEIFRSAMRIRGTVSEATVVSET